MATRKGVKTSSDVVSLGHNEPRRPPEGGAEVAAMPQRDEGVLAVVRADDRATPSIAVEGAELAAPTW